MGRSDREGHDFNEYLNPKVGNADLCSGYISSMRKKLRKVTKEQLRSDDSYEAAMRRALARKPFLKTDGEYLSREEVHDRAIGRKACPLK